jgi:hypothetical protein
MGLRRILAQSQFFYRSPPRVLWHSHQVRSPWCTTASGLVGLRLSNWNTFELTFAELAPDNRIQAIVDDHVFVDYASELSLQERI